MVDAVPPSNLPSERTVVHVSLAVPAAELDPRARQLKDAGLDGVFFRSADEMKARLSECEFLLVGRPPRIDWTEAKLLRLLQVAGSGVDPLFPARGLAAGVAVANCRGAHADAIRDHAVALLLSFARGLPRYLEQQGREQWQPFAEPSLRGKRLVLVGLGEIGSRIAHVARALGMNVAAVRRTQAPSTDVDRVVGPRQLSDVFEGADYVVLCAPHTDATRGLIGRSELDALPDHAVLVDVSRGGVLDEAALVETLRAGRLRGAALDVFAREPIAPGDPLWTTPNLIVTPHVAGWTPDYLERVFDVFIDNVRRVRSGTPPATTVSREHQY